VRLPAPGGSDGGRRPALCLGPDVAASISFRLSSDHLNRLPGFADHFRTLPMSAYLHVTRTAPANDAERRLRAVSDPHYRAIVAARAAGMGQAPQVDGPAQAPEVEHPEGDQPVVDGAHVQPKVTSVANRRAASHHRK